MLVRSGGQKANRVIRSDALHQIKRREPEYCFLRESQSEMLSLGNRSRSARRGKGKDTDSRFARLFLGGTAKPKVRRSRGIRRSREAFKESLGLVACGGRISLRSGTFRSAQVRLAPLDQHSLPHSSTPTPTILLGRASSSPHRLSRLSLPPNAARPLRAV